MILISRKGKDWQPVRVKVAGLAVAVMERVVRKGANKSRILALLAAAEGGQAGNAELRLALGVPERSIVRYLDELEREGKVSQVGDTGRGVVYKLK